MATYYGNDAFEGFGKAFASMMGVQVTFAQGASPQVDGTGKITLPTLDTYQTKEEFEDTCASVIHEIAHVWKGAHKLFADMLTGKPQRTKLFMECLNAVLDVANESQIGQDQAEKGNYRTEQLLVASNAHCWNNRKADFTDKTGRVPATWQILATGIIRTRVNSPVPGFVKHPVKGRTTCGRGVMERFKGQVDVAQVFKELAQARRTALINGSPAYQEWYTVQIAERIEKLILPIAPPESQEPAESNQPGQPGTNGQGTPMPGGMGSKGTAADAMAKGLPSRLVHPSEMATEQEGAQAGGIGPGQSNPTKAGGGAAYGQSGAIPAVGGIRADPGTLAHLTPVIRRIADRIATDGDSLSHDGGYSVGGSVMNVHRLFTDGNCMGRWNTDPHADGMALSLCLDISSSMDQIIRQVMAIAEAFSQAMEDCATIHRLTFGSDVTVVRDFLTLANMEGSTNTELAIMDSRKWMKGQQAGKKVCIIITDGEPGIESETQHQCRQARQDGIRVVGIGLEVSVGQLQANMPGAICYSANTPQILAMQLERLSYELEAMRV